MLETQTETLHDAAAANTGQKRLRNVYSWASRNTSEARQAEDFKYIWPDSVKKLLDILERSDGSIFALIGLSGVGKSSAQVQLAKALNARLQSDGSKKKAVHFKWPGQLDQNCERILGLLKAQGLLPAPKEVTRALAERLVRARDARVVLSRIKEVIGNRRLSEEDVTLLNEASNVSNVAAMLAKLFSGTNEELDALLTAEKLLGPRDLKSFWKEMVISSLQSCHTILIDLRDYGLRDCRAMNADLWDIQILWQLIVEHIRKSGRPKDHPPNLVFVLQKELVMSQDNQVANYFLRKAAGMFEISPFSSSEMIQAYTEEFGTLDPFDEDALRLLARYSRGVFRRFLRYIQVCLNHHPELLPSKEKDEEKALNEGKTTVLTQEFVEQVVTSEDLLSDWSIELRQIFPKGNYDRVAIELMKVLGACPMTLKELAQNLSSTNISDLSRIISKLEGYGYLKRSPLTDRGRVISLNW